jgi:hypothetical protein
MDKTYITGQYKVFMTDIVDQYGMARRRVLKIPTNLYAYFDSVKAFPEGNDSTLTVHKIEDLAIEEYIDLTSAELLKLITIGTPVQYE